MRTGRPKAALTISEDEGRQLMALARSRSLPEQYVVISTSLRSSLRIAILTHLLILPAHFFRPCWE